MTTLMSGKSERRVDIYDHGERIGDAKVNDDGSWRFECSSLGIHRMTAGYLGTISEPQRVFTILPDTSYNFEDLDEGSVVLLKDKFLELSHIYCRNSDGVVNSEGVFLYGKSVNPYGLSLLSRDTTTTEVTIQFKKPFQQMTMKFQHRRAPPVEPAHLLVSYWGVNGESDILETKDIIYPVGGVAEFLPVEFNGSAERKCYGIKVKLVPGAGGFVQLCLNSFEFIK